MYKPRQYGRRLNTIRKMTKAMLRIGLIAMSNFTIITASQAATVPIINAGFEDPVVPAGTFTTTQDIPGWTIISTGSPDPRAGVWNPLFTQYPEGIPEGNQVGYSNGPTMSQVLPWMLAANVPYNLTVEIGNRADPFQIDGYEIQLLAGGVVLEFFDETMLLPEPGTFLTATLSFIADPENPNIGQPLEIRLLSDGPQVNFDNINLEAVPIPAAVWLFGSGLIGLIGIARRKKT